LAWAVKFALHVSIMHSVGLVRNRSGRNTLRCSQAAE